MSNIRGSKSGNRPQRARWVFTPLDFMFMWAWSGVLLLSPIIEWVLKKSGRFLHKSWVGELCGRIFLLVPYFNFLKEYSFST